jgi:DNA mismatch repair protein MLH1
MKEKPCFGDFLRELARFHCPAALDGPNTDEQQWQIQHILFPAFKQYLVAPVGLAAKENVLQIASIDKLYRVFERCTWHPYDWRKRFNVSIRLAA